MMKTRSRLSRNLERKSQKTFFLTLLGIIVIIVLLVKAGIPLLINASLSLKGGKQADSTTTSQKDTYVAPPILDYMQEATNSAKINISGKAIAKQKIKLYVNDENTDDTTVGNNGVFHFDDVPVTKGQNSIKVKALSDQKQESDFSNELTITYKEGKLTLSIDQPNDGQTFKKDDNFANISGRTDPGNNVTVNGFGAIVDSNGNYSYRLPLQSGDNKIHVVASDNAGNKAETERKVIYNP